MILFFNVFITDKSLAHNYFRGDLKTDDKVDVFKTTLSSLANIYPWNQVIIQYKLDESYKHRSAELHTFITSLFIKHPNFRITSDYRNEHQQQWIKTYESFVNDDLIFYSCNHDHIFVDNREYFQYCVEKFKYFSAQNAALVLSHWPEMIQSNHNYQNNFLIGPLLCVERNIFDSFLIITKKFFKTMWVDSKLGDAFLPRSDMANQGVNFADKSLNDIKMTTCMPSRELFRHYDGYVRMAHSMIYHESHPALTLPVSIPNQNNLDFVKKYLNILVGQDSPRYNYLLSQHEEFIQYIDGKRRNFRG